MKEYSKAYNKEAINLALARVTIKPCLRCGHPVIDGNCCEHCGSTYPTSRNQDESLVEV